MNAQLVIFLVALAGECLMSPGPPTRTRKGKRPTAHFLAPVQYAPVLPSASSRRPVPSAAPRRPFLQSYMTAVAPKLLMSQSYLSAVVPKPSVPGSYLSAVVPQSPVTRLYLPATVARQPPKPAYMSYPPPAVVPVPVPAAPSTYLTCEEQCPLYPAPVCGIYGTTYDNDCLRQCSAEPKDCNDACPCPAPATLPPLLGGCGYCNVFASYDPVCVDDDETLFNECEANCRGKRVLCSQACPC